MNQNIITIISTFGATVLTALGDAIKHLWSQQHSIRDGMLALMHDRIFTICTDCIDKKYATVEEMRNLTYLYEPYHALGGNGTGTEMYKRVMSLPTEPPQSSTA